MYIGSGLRDTLIFPILEIFLILQKSLACNYLQAIKNGDAEVVFELQA